MAAVAFLRNPDATSPCNLCSCNPEGLRSEPIMFQLGSEAVPISRCLRRWLPDWSFELAEQVLVFKRRGILPVSGGWTEQPNTFVDAVRALGWGEETDTMTSMQRGE